MANKVFKIDWNCKSIDAHRRGISDMGWCKMQPKGRAKYKIGDVVEFKVGGFGVINEVSESHNGWPSSYSVNKTKGRPFHTGGKVAWHYEGDFENVQEARYENL